jgi:hypothetical protein
LSQSKSKYEIWRQASLSQILSDAHKEYADYAGAEPKISVKLARMRIMGQYGILDLEDPNIKIMWDLLNEERKALFATSEKVNEITKMGLQMPKSENIIGKFDEEAE